MNNVKSFVVGFVLALSLAVAGAGFAQSTAQGDQNKKHESCCAMESCCCKGESCSMNHGEQHAQKEEGKEQSHKGGCCCCGGDSCQMKMKEKQK